MTNSGYYDWMNGKQTCTECGWTGQGSETALGEGFNDGGEYHCPECDHYFGFHAYPLLEESLADPRAPKSDKKFAETVTRRADKNENK